MAREFDILNAKVNINVDSAKAEKHINAVAAAIEVLQGTTKGGAKSIDDIKLALNNVATASDAISKGSFKKLTAVVREGGKQFEISSKGIDQIGLSLKSATNSADESAAKFDQIQDSFVNFDRSILKVAQNSLSAFGTIRDGGSVVESLKFAMFGLNDATGVTGAAFNTLGTVSRVTGNVLGIFDDKQTKLRRGLENLSSDLSLASSSLEALNAEFKSIAKAETGTEKNQFSGLTKQITSTTNEFQRLQRIILTGGKASQAEIDRIKVEFEATNRQIEVARIRAGELGEKGEAAFNKLVKPISSLENGFEQLITQSSRLEKEQKKVAAAATQSAKEMKEGAKESGFSFLSLFNIFKRGEKDVDNFKSSVKEANTTIKQSNQLVQGLGFTLSSLTGGIIGGGLVQAIPAVFSALQNKLTGAVSAASDAEEEMSKFAVVFDSELDPNIKESDSLVQSTIESLDLMAEQLGRSKYELRAFAAQFQDTFVPLGFAREEAAKLSLSLTELTQDLSSFYNLAERDVADRISSFLVGNYENARAFGVIVNDASLNAELLAMGIEGGTRAVDQQVKSMVALKLLYKGTGDAQGDVIATSNGFANQLRQIQGAARDSAVELGQKLLPILSPLLAAFIRISSEIGPTLALVFNRIYETILPLTTVFTSVLQGATSLEDLKIVVNNALVGIMNSLNSFIPEAYEWGWSWGTEIYNGLVDVADSLISQAAEYIGSIISSFLEPGSPPEQGPLSTIDKWGVGLMDTFSEGFQNSKIDLLTNILGPVADALQGSGNTALFGEIRDGLADIIEQASATGDVDTAGIDSLLAGVLPDEEIEATKRNIEEKAKLLKLQNDLDEAKSSGDVTSIISLEQQIKDQQSLVAEQEQRLGAENKLLALEDKIAKKDNERAAAAKNLGGAAAAAGKALEKYKKTAQDAYQEERNQLIAVRDAKLAAAKTDEERLSVLEWYNEQSIKAEEKWLKSSENSNKEATATRISEFRKSLDEIQKDLEKFNPKTGGGKGGSGAGGKLGLADLGLDVESFLPSKEEVTAAIKTAADDIVLNTKQTLVDSYNNVSFTEVATTIGQKLYQALRSGIQTIKGLLDKIPEELRLPIITLIGFFTSDAVFGALGLLEKITKSLFGVFGGTSKLLPMLKKIVTVVGRWSVAGFIVWGVIYNWDLIVGTIIERLKVLGAQIQEAIKNIYDLYITLTSDTDFVKSMQKIASAVSLIFLAITDFASLVLQVVKDVFDVAVFTIIFAVTDMFNSVIEAFGGSEEFANSFAEAFSALADTVVGVATKITNAYYDIMGGDFDAALANLKEIPGLILGLFSDEEFTSFFTTLFSAVTDTLIRWAQNLYSYVQPYVQPFIDKLVELFSEGGALYGITIAVNSIRDAFTSAFDIIANNSDVLNQALLLGQEIWQALYDIVFENKEILILIGGIIGTVLVVAVNTILSALEALGNALPFIIEAFAGVLQSVRGVIQVLRGFMLFIRAVVSAVVGLFTGDMTEASLLLQQAWEALSSGLSNIFEGILVTLVNLGAGIFTFAVDFVTSFIANIVSLVSEGGADYAIAVRDGVAYFKDLVLQIVDTVTETIKQLPTVIGHYMEKAWEITKDWVKSWLDPFIDFQDEVVENSIIPDTMDSIVDYIIELGPRMVTGLVEGIPKVISSFVSFGKDILTGLLDGLGDGDLISNITGFIGSLFSGGPEETETDDAGFGSSLSTMGLGFTTFLNTIKEQMLAFRTVDWFNFITNLQLQWTTFSNSFYLNFMQGLLNLKTEVSSFYTEFVISITDLRNHVINTALEFTNLDDTISKATDNTKENLENTENALNSLIDVIKKVTEAYNKMADAARKAASATTDVLGSSGLVPLDSFAKGTDRVPQTGIYKLHKNEAVLNPQEAKIYRTLIDGLETVKTTASGNLSSLLSNLSSMTQNNTVSTKSKTANVNVYANYQNLQSQGEIKDDVLFSLRLAGYGGV